MVFEVDPVEDLSAAVDWFVEAVGSRTPRPIRRTSDHAGTARDLAELEERITPYRLPPEIRWFWETWDPFTFVVLPAPNLHSASAAFECWSLLSWEDPAECPRALLPVGYTSHTYRLMDLSGPNGTPAAMWDYDFDQNLVCDTPSLAALLRACAERAEQALLDQPPPTTDTDWYAYYHELFGGPELQAILDRHFAASPAERQRLSPYEPETWPEPWRQAQRAMTGGSHPRGPTHTVAEFLALLNTGHPRVRLRGVLTQMSGLEGGHDWLMRLEDETGDIDLAVPPSALAPGGKLGVAEEVEVVGRGPLPPRPERQIDPRKVQQMEERYGSWVAYLMSDEGLHDPELQESLDEHIKELAAYKQLIPLVERTDRLGT